MFLIEKNTITVDCSQKQTGNQLIDEISFVLKHSFYPKLEKLLQKYDSQNTIWNIDFLPISLKAINYKNWKQEIVEESLLQIEKYLEEHKPRNTSSTVISVNSNTSEQISKKHYIQNLFIEYLKTGLLKPNSVSNKLAVIFNKLTVDEAFIHRLEHLFLYETDLILRWSLSIPKKIKAAYLKEKSILVDFNFIKKVIKTPNVVEYVEYLYWISILDKKQIFFTYSEVKKLRNEASTYYGIHKDSFDKLIKELLNKDLQKAKNEKIDSVFSAFIKNLINSSKEQNKENKIHNIDLEKQLKEERKLKKKIDKTHYINNGGIILLHPFLATLFQKLGYLNNNRSKWKNRQSQHRAVLISQYLLNFETEIFENDLLLNKILCGVAVNDTVHTNWEITKYEKEQCEKLLLSVIEHWKVLKNTTISVLQESFLQREAKIVENQSNVYEITVEQKSIDILLDQLPWGLGMIKTPWMEEFLTCYWSV